MGTCVGNAKESMGESKMNVHQLRKILSNFIGNEEVSLRYRISTTRALISGNKYLLILSQTEDNDENINKPRKTLLDLYAEICQMYSDNDIVYLVQPKSEDMCLSYDIYEETILRRLRRVMVDENMKLEMSWENGK